MYKQMVQKKIVTTEETTEKVEKSKYEVVETEFDDFGFEQDETEGLYDLIYFVKPKTKDAAYFEFSRKVGNQIQKDSRKTIQTIDGKPTKIELGSYTYENKEVKTIKLSVSKEINGKNCLFIISSSYTQVARSLMNSILGCTKPLEKINITLYKNATGYTSLKVSINGAKSIWKYSIEEQRKLIETITNKKGEFVSNDYSDLDNMLEEKMREHLGILFPEQEHVRFVPETEKLEVKDQEATFGSLDDQASEFFDLGNED